MSDLTEQNEKNIRRRDFLRLSLGAGALFTFGRLNASQQKNRMATAQSDTDREATTWYVFDHIITYARANGFHELPLGEIMGKIGKVLIATPYVGGTLEGSPERCRIDLTGMDCVTFFEDVLGISRILKKGKTTFDDLIKEITYTRYRGGKLNGYLSRLHYTADWIADNTIKKVVKNITPMLAGAVQLPLNVSFMSQHPQYYPPLAADETLVPRIAETERAINATKHWYVPTSAVKTIEPQLMTGDIIAVATNKEGLDYAHTGLIFRDERNRARFLHASLDKKRVFLDKTISGYLKGVPSHIGITIVRPI
ncbi:MAG: DUF1460 domain-containing protein [Bacteroidetes bacterium]|nr:DUF1460 domain-containing protein [Bacteroidota bacterium]